MINLHLFKYVKIYAFNVNGTIKFMNTLKIEICSLKTFNLIVCSYKESTFISLNRYKSEKVHLGYKGVESEGFSFRVTEVCSKRWLWNMGEFLY